MKNSLTAKIMFLSTSALLLFGCGNNEDNNSEKEVIEDSTQSSQPNESLQNEDTTEHEKNNDEAANGMSESDSQTENELDEKEMHEYVRSLAENPELVEKRALENIELRGIHQNTFIYNGRIHPDNNAFMQFEGDEGYSDDRIDLEVNEEGYFTVVFDEWDLESHAEILLTIAVPGTHREDVFHLPIHAAENGMEVIEAHNAPKSVKSDLSESLELNAIYPTTLIYNSPFGGYARGLAYQMNDRFYTLSTPKGSGSNSTYFQTPFEEYPEAGQHITFFIPMNGFIVTVEKQVQEISEEAQEAIDRMHDQTEFPAIGKDKGEPGGNGDSTDFYGKTVPNAHIAIGGKNQSGLASTGSNDTGEFTLSLYDPFPEKDDTLYFTIRDEDGYTETFEVKAE